VLLDLETVFTQVRREFRLFALIVAAAAAISVVAALLSRPVYRAEAVVAPVGQDRAASALGGLGAQLGGLAGLGAGLLGSGDDWNRALAVLRSRHLIEELVTRENLLPVLFSKKPSWIPRTGGMRAATMGDAVEAFRKRILQIREDSRANLATVRVEWYDPVVAAAWANELVAIADAEERAHAMGDARSALDALQTELGKTDGVELRTAIARLMEEQLKARMVAGVRTQFQYRVIDPAVPADLDKRIQPTRTTMVLAGTFGGVLVAVILIMSRFERARRKAASGGAAR
jgi:uncharacterized protein involved in exopolysaccharide biosynthesis